MKTASLSLLVLVLEVWWSSALPVINFFGFVVGSQGPPGRSRTRQRRARVLSVWGGAVCGAVPTQEVQLLQCLHHPNIISLEDSFLTENHLVLILEYAGGDLRQLIDKQRAAGFLLMERHVWGLFTQVTEAC